jgi:hypothetical protein
MVAFLETDEAKTRIMHQPNTTLGISIKQEFLNKLCN